MTEQELLEECNHKEEAMVKAGFKAEDAHLILVRSGWPKGMSANLAPGLKGRCVGTDLKGCKKICFIDVLTKDVRAWLKRRGIS